MNPNFKKSSYDFKVCVSVYMYAHSPFLQFSVGPWSSSLYPLGLNSIQITNTEYTLTSTEK